MDGWKLAIVKPNKSSYSETFIQTHIERLIGEKKVLYGGDFPVYKEDGKFLIGAWWKIVWYLIEKRVFAKRDIPVRNQAFVRYLRQKQIQVVLAEYGTVGAAIAKACQLAGVPLVIHFHGVDAYRHELLKTFTSLYQAAFAYASALIVVSGDMRNQLVRLGAPPSKIHLIPYGVNTELFQQVKLSRQLNFLCIGRLVDKKAPLVTIAAFAKVCERFPEAHLRMVGDGPLMNEAQEQVQKMGLEQQVTFTGVLNRQQILELMHDSYCYVQHSVTAADGDKEGTPNTILEASAVGLPIVSTRHAGIQEAVLDGKTGWLVAEYDLDGMAEKMLTLATFREMAERMGQAARQHMLQHYQLSQQIAKLQAILEKASQNRLA